MKKILLLLAVAILVALGLTGLSSAYFSDVETSEGNIITAGTTELQVVGEVDFYFEVDKKGHLKQGASGVATIELFNAGSTDGVAELHIMNLLNYENGCEKGEKKKDDTCGDPGDEGELGANLLITITYNGNPVCLPGDGDQVVDMPLDNLNCENLILGDLGAGVEEPATVVIAWKLPGKLGRDVRHSIKGDSVSFCTEFSLGW